MPLYIALNADGSQRRVSARDRADVDIKDGRRVKELPHWDAEPSAETHRWDPSLEDYVPLASTGTTPVMSRGVWMDRIGSANEELLHLMRLDTNTPLPLRAKLERFHSELLRRADVDVRHKSTQEAAPALAALFLQAGRITDADAFVAMLLAEEPIVPE